MGNTELNDIDSILEKLYCEINLENSYRCYIKIRKYIEASKFYKRSWVCILQERKKLHKKEVYCGNIQQMVGYGACQLILGCRLHKHIFLNWTVISCLTRVRYQKFYRWTNLWIIKLGKNHKKSELLLALAW